ncbi:binding-protein-dependent transport systems inner membrane component [Ruminiclostridium papyrosolvens DSM 2782]|uniref:Binding-protein-dependent transport systems inner membrane component n=1 Tax=Ruminiclostridium papyrosolvens DSM 2782 TaxID=588581 RepID=F1T835_9FIRM|nr:carbohydrate ABC transporter permease [Ruminiclostridium papyrosolvens]EGD49633.1 binding-protein-dependent transport systems inner membrane component [Ruminiclostridium papyrosolvens DSM 2782]WES33235.1 carbohydrate ABC transporter permease [Ruminiclostridium papyrosolvens DSM 2782]
MSAKTTQSIVRDKKNIKDYLTSFFKWVLIIFFAVYTLFPLLWLFITSLKTNAEYFDNPFSLPAVPQWQNYVNAFQQANLGRMISNSVIVAVTATVINVLIAAMLSYCLSRFKFKGREVIFTLFSVGVLVPLNALMVPYFSIFSKMGLVDSLGALIILYAAIGLPISTFIIRGFMASFPAEIEEAAYIDGSGFYGRFFKMILPLTKTGLVTAATFEFITCWNEFVYANLLTSSPVTKTIQIGIRYFTNQFTTDYVSMYAAIIISIAPSIIGYMLFQKQVISGLTSGAVKG